METSKGFLLAALRLPLFILPIRNGNNQGIPILIPTSFAFYPTYKEWKLCTIH